MAVPFAAGNEEPLPAWLHAELQRRGAGELRLPVLPDTACRVMAACQDEHSDLRDLAELVTHDQSLATHVLRVANSVAYAPKTPILSLRHALGRLGLSTVSDVALALAVKQRLFTVPGHERRIQELWQHSALTACWAQDVARLLGTGGDTAFLSGLLHDVGMPIVMQTVCDVVRERSFAAVNASVMEAAMHVFHGIFGLQVAERWRLGPHLAAAISYHHDPSAAPLCRDEVLIVTVADALADWEDGEPDLPLELGALWLSEEHRDELRGARGRILETARAF